MVSLTKNQSKICNIDIIKAEDILKSLTELMTWQEQDLVTYALKTIEWDSENPEIVYLTADEAANAAGISCEKENLSSVLNDIIGNICMHSFCLFETEEGYSIRFFFVPKITISHNFVRIVFDREYIHMFRRFEFQDV